MISINGAGTATGNSWSANNEAAHVSVSADGTKVAFTSNASDLGSSDTNGHWDVYVRDLTAGTTTLVSVNAAGTDSGNSQSGGQKSPAISPDGTKVAFVSFADDLGPPDTNSRSDVYVRDLVAGTTTLVSANLAGADGGNDDSRAPVFDPSSDAVAFESTATDLTANDTNTFDDVYLRDLTTGTTTLVSVDATGTNGGDGHSFLSFPAFEPQHVFSPDGSTIIIHSEAGNLGPVDSARPTAGPNDVYLRDLADGTTTLVSANSAGTDSGNGWSGHATLSADGSSVLFTSAASDLGPTDTNGHYDVFIRDLATGTVELVSTAASGTTSGNSGSQLAELSADGTKVVFESNASDLGPTDTVMCQSVPWLPPYNCTDVYMRDLATGVTTMVSVNAAGTDGSRSSNDASFGADGTKVLFTSIDSSFGPTDTIGGNDVYLRDLVTGTTTLVSTNGDGTDSTNGGSYFPLFATPAGDRVIFSTTGTNLGYGDANGNGWDLYIAPLG